MPLPDTELAMLRDQGRRNRVRLKTQILLRWIAVAGQTGAALVAALVYGLIFPTGLVAITIGAAGIANLLAAFLLPATRRLSEGESTAMLVFDIVQLSVLLWLTGGLDNPFALLMLAPVTISATMLRLPGVLLIGGLALVSVTVLWLWSLPILSPQMTALSSPELLRFGFWLALATGITFIGLYVRRVTLERQAMGDALAAGVEVLAAGTIVTPGAVAVLAAVGADPVWVHSRPCVAVIATGDELVDAASPLSPGQIRDSNGPTLAAMAEAAEATVLGPLRARDTVADLDRVLDTAGDADVIVFAGGVSMGERDGVRDAVEARGGSWTLWGVRQRPGKPLAVGVLDGRPVLGLPGNPVSAAVCFEVYVRPLLAAMLGRPADAVTEAAVLDAPISKKVGLRTFARVTVRRDADGRLHAFPAGAQGSHVAHSLALADGLAHLPADWDAAPAGATVAFQRWGGPSG